MWLRLLKITCGLSGLHPDITESVKETVVAGNLRLELVCNNHFHNMGMWPKLLQSGCGVSTQIKQETY